MYSKSLHTLGTDELKE